MLTLVPNTANPAPTARRPRSQKNVRTQTLAAINATWRKLCPLEGEELRDARLAFATKALGLRKPLKSLSKCSPKQLGRIIDAMRERERAPALPGVETGRMGDGATGRNISASPALPISGSAEIHHLATSAQGTAIERLRNYLGWTAIGLQKFIVDRYAGKHSPALLTPDEANSATMILFNIAAARRIKNRAREAAIAKAKAESREPTQEELKPPTVSRPMIRAEIPSLKRELGIDQKPAADFADYSHEENT